MKKKLYGEENDTSRTKLCWRIPCMVVRGDSVHTFAMMSGMLDLSRDEKAKHFYVQMVPIGTA